MYIINNPTLAPDELVLAAQWLKVLSDEPSMVVAEIPNHINYICLEERHGFQIINITAAEELVEFEHSGITQSMQDIINKEWKKTKRGPIAIVEQICHIRTNKPTIIWGYTHDYANGIKINSHGLEFHCFSMPRMPKHATIDGNIYMEASNTCAFMLPARGIIEKEVNKLVQNIVDALNLIEQNTLASQMQPENIKTIIAAINAGSEKQFIDDIMESEEAIANMEDGLFDAIKRRNQGMACLNGLRENSKETTEKALQDILMLRNWDTLKELSILGTVTSFRYGPIIGRSKDKEHLVGEIDVVINFEAGKMFLFAVDMLNGSQSPHPHYRQGPCWGNITTDITTAMAQFQLKETIGMIVQWLENIDYTDIWASIISSYPQIEKGIITNLGTDMKILNNNIQVGKSLKDIYGV